MGGSRRYIEWRRAIRLVSFTSIGVGVNDEFRQVSSMLTRLDETHHSHRRDQAGPVKAHPSWLVAYMEVCALWRACVPLPHPAYAECRAGWSLAVWPPAAGGVARVGYRALSRFGACERRARAIAAALVSAPATARWRIG